MEKENGNGNKQTGEMAQKILTNVKEGDFSIADHSFVSFIITITVNGPTRHGCYG